MTWREISSREMNELKRFSLIDVRSPCEFKEEHIPGAVNVPLFSDEERAIVGTIYATQGESVARRKGLDIIAPKIPLLVDKILALRSGGPLIIHCWRGGLRSEAVASCLSIIGVDSWRLSGGYKAWRRQLLDDFEAGYDFGLVVLHGHTGVGKTEILHILAERGQPVLDLEKIAGHRGSVFGAMGLAGQPSQKNFDAAIWSAVRNFRGQLVFCEAESKKVGNLRLPDFISRKIEAGRRVLLTGSLEARRERILRDYVGEDLDEAQLSTAFRSLAALKERLGAKLTKEIESFGKAGNFAPAVESLLIHYYDPLYQKEIDRCQPYELTIDGDLPEQAAQKLLAFADRLRPHTESGAK